MGDFSEVVSKLALLTNAGMILREAWELTANAGEGIFYEEMQTAVAEMKMEYQRWKQYEDLESVV